MSSRILQEKQIQLSALNAKRDEKRQRVEDLQSQIDAMQKKQDNIVCELGALDRDISSLENEVWLLQSQQNGQHRTNTSSTSAVDHADVESPLVVLSESKRAAIPIDDFEGGAVEEELTEQEAMTMSMHPDEQLTDPTTQQTQEINLAMEHAHASLRPGSRSSSIGPLELTRPTKIAASSRNKALAEKENNKGHAKPPAAASRGTLDAFIISSSSSKKRSHAGALPSGQAVQSTDDPPETGTSPFFQQRPYDPNAHYKADNFPWSQQMLHHLRQTFRIQAFRDHQKEICNATLSGDDVFVIMRTGGGKSLTYQLRK